MAVAPAPRAARRTLGWLALALAGALAGCRYVVPQVVLRTDTDMTQGPGQTLTAVRVEVTSQGESTPRFAHTFTLGPEPLLPAELVITPRGNDAQRVISVDVSAIQGDTTLFTHRSIVPFAEGRISLLNVFLADRCRDPGNQVCEPGTTCGPLGCEPIRVVTLPDYTPQGDSAVRTDIVATPDAGVDGTADVGADGASDATRDAASDREFDAAVDAAGDTGRTELDVLVAPDSLAAMDAPAELDTMCGAGLTLCSGTCVDTQTRPDHCGRCGHNCAALAGVEVVSVSCAGAQCRFTCRPGLGDCDGNPDNGCETMVNTLANCGACRRACVAGLSCVPAGPTFVCSSACIPGADCSGGNPCVVATIDCSSGTPLCESSFVGAGMSCGAGRVCDGMGMCVNGGLDASVVDARTGADASSGFDVSMSVDASMGVDTSPGDAPSGCETGPDSRITCVQEVGPGFR